MSKKIILKFCLAGILCLLMLNYGFCGEEGPPEDALIIDLSNVDVDILKGFEENPEDSIGKFVFYAPPGYEMKFKFSLTGNVVVSTNTEDVIKVTFDKPVYFYAPEEGDPLFSIDGEEWEKTDELFSGSISFGCGVEKEDEVEEEKTIFNLNFEINLREEE